MCGIAGILGEPGGAGVEAVRRMVGALGHRGPDGSGVVALDDRCVLGHTRLAILDLSKAADQPLANETGDVHVVFNGEIYNYRSLRAEMIGAGHQFRSTGDSEVIVHAYEEYGADGFVEHLDGMFAFALYDTPRHRLVLARDRAGKKPLFVTLRKGGTWFASELAALRAVGIPLDLRQACLPQYLTRGYVPAPDTLVEGVEQLEPGTAVLVGHDGRRHKRRYWTHPATRIVGAPGAFEPRLDAAVSRVRSQLRHAVETRLAADVPLGAFLSGGIDSAAVVALAQQIAGKTIKTFTIGFRGPASWDETAAARATARALGTDHTEHIAGPEEVTRLPELVARCGEPLADPSIIPTHLVARLAREQVTVVLTGDGGDELFAGYRRFLVAELARFVPRAFGALAGSLLRWLPDSETYAGLTGYARRFAAAAGRSPGATLMELAGAFPPTQALNLCGRVGLSGHALDAAIENLARPELEAMTRARAAGRPGIHAVLAANFATYLPGDLLPKADRATMAVSLEARAPLLDTQLIETAARCAPSLLVSRGRLKWLLKHALSEWVPPEVLHRPKHGFGIPVGIWMRGPLREWTESLLGSTRSCLASHLDHRAIRALWDEHLGGNRDHGLRLWALCALECWLQWLRETRSERADVDPAAGVERS